VVDYSAGIFRFYTRNANNTFSLAGNPGALTGMTPAVVDITRDGNTMVYGRPGTASCNVLDTSAQSIMVTIPVDPVAIGVRKTGQVAIIYDGINNRYRYHSLSTGSETTFNLLNYGTSPYSIAVSNNSTSGFVFFVGVSRDNNLILWHNQGAATRTLYNMGSLDANCRASIADNGETFIVSHPTVKSVFVFKRSGTANNTLTLIQTITSTENNYGLSADLSADGQHIVIGKEYWSRTGDTFIRRRDVDFLNGNYGSGTSLSQTTGQTYIENATIRNNIVYLNRYS
jgi:hypothetical protein